MTYMYVKKWILQWKSKLFYLYTIAMPIEIKENNKKEHTDLRIFAVEQRLPIV